jgi:hypothetical protein
MKISSSLAIPAYRMVIIESETESESVSTNHRVFASSVRTLNRSRIALALNALIAFAMPDLVQTTNVRGIEY